ncbi:MAG: hypothetical protein AAFY71_17990 [Bacteroidota bacterium]
MNPTLTRLFLCVLCFCSWAKLNAQSEPIDFSGKTIGLYITGKNFFLDATFDNQYVQYLQQGDEDRSYAGRLKTEVMIRLGSQLSEQLKVALDADSIVFMNAVPSKGRAFQQNYDSTLQSIRRKPSDLNDLDYIVFLEAFILKARYHRSVYIRSNRMITEKIPIMRLNMRMNVITPSSGKVIKTDQICFDKQTSRVENQIFDFYSKSSPTGKYLADCFTAWRLQQLGFKEFSCNP